MSCKIPQRDLQGDYNGEEIQRRSGRPDCETFYEKPGHSVGNRRVVLGRGGNLLGDSAGTHKIRASGAVTRKGADPLQRYLLAP